MFVEGIVLVIYKAIETSASFDMDKLDFTTRKTGTGHSDLLDRLIQIDRPWLPVTNKGTGFS